MRVCFFLFKATLLVSNKKLLIQIAYVTLVIYPMNGHIITTSNEVSLGAVILKLYFNDWYSPSAL